MRTPSASPTRPVTDQDTSKQDVSLRSERVGVAKVYARDTQCQAQQSGGGATNKPPSDPPTSIPPNNGDGDDDGRPKPPRIYTTRDLAKLEHRSERTVREWILTGHLKAWRRGRRQWVIEERDYEDMKRRNNPHMYRQRGK
jgi:hypothetical protein